MCITFIRKHITHFVICMPNTFSFTFVCFNSLLLLFFFSSVDSISKTPFCVVKFWIHFICCCRSIVSIYFLFHLRSLIVIRVALESRRDAKLMCFMHLIFMPIGRALRVTQINTDELIEINMKMMLLWRRCNLRFLFFFFLVSIRLGEQLNGERNEIRSWILRKR